MRILCVASLIVVLVQQQNPKATVDGIVAALGSVKPIPGARVALTQQRGAATSSYIPQVTTDDSGRFHFQGLNEGTYEMQVQANGYISSEMTVLFKGSQAGERRHFERSRSGSRLQ